MTSAQEQTSSTAPSKQLDAMAMMAAINNSLTAERPPVGDNGVALGPDLPAEPDVQFKVGWSYDVFLRKNKLSPSEAAGSEWKRLSREASKAQVARMAQLTDKGFKTTCKRTAIWNGKSKSWDTALTARVVSPDCDDADLIRDAYVKAQARQAKLLSSMRAAAIDQGADIGE